MTQKEKINVLMLGPDLDVKGGISSVEKLILKYAPENINYIFIPTMKEGNNLYKIFVFIFALIRILYCLILKKVDLVHINFSAKGSLIRKFLIVITCILLRKKYILHSHSGTIYDFIKQLPTQIVKLLSGLINRSSGLIVLSNSWRNLFTGFLNVRNETIHVLPNPVVIPQVFNREYNSTKNTIQLIYLGRIDDRKGGLRLIKAYSTLSLEYIKKSKLTLAGDGEITKARALVKTLGLNEKIKILNWVNDKEKDLLLTGSDIFILPSRNEGLSMSMLEAMSYGLAVIVSPVGGIPEVIKNEENGLIIDPNSIDEISKGIERLIYDENLRKTLGLKAKETVKNLDIKNYVKELEKIYNSILVNKSL